MFRINVVPPFSLFENGGETEGVKTSAKTIHFRILGNRPILLFL